ncbi:MAG: N-6 DNA methylase, partial [Chromatiaceae bacterium]|nr:N-6 DNA methylase [Chromatiaceae bacterium]
SAQSGEGDIRRAMVEGDVVDCMIALPGQLFYSTQIPACLWFMARDKKNHNFRNRRGEVLFIDARKLGNMVDRTRKELTDDDIANITAVYHAWRGEDGAEAYEDVPGFCKAATLEEIREHSHVLTPGRYVGAAAAEEDDVPFVERFTGLKENLDEQLAKGEELGALIKGKLERIIVQ